MGLLILLGVFIVYLIGFAVTVYLSARRDVSDTDAFSFGMFWPLVFCVVPFFYALKLGKKHRERETAK